MPKPIVCLSDALRQYLEIFRPCFRKRQWKYFVIVLLGLCGMRRTKDAERSDALGGGTSQLVGNVAVFEQVAVVDRRSGDHLDEAVSRTNGT